MTDARAAWDAVLTALELELEAPGASGLAADRGSGSVWSEPTELGPMPRELVGRASRLLAAQRDRIADLETGRRVAAGHMGALRAVDATREPRGSVYLDASA